MAISKTANGILSAAAHPVSLGLGAFNYGMGQTSMGGAAGQAIAGSAGHELMSAVAKKIFRGNPIGTALTLAGDMFLGPDFMQAGERLGNKFMPIKWGKNRLPSTYEQQ